MKKTCIFLTAILFSINTYAQNTAWSTTGNIGIGTVTPAANLEIDHLVSGLSIHSVYPPALKINGNDNSTASYNLMELWANTFTTTFLHSTTTRQMLFFVNTAGLVGINKALAYYTLDVGGNIWADNSILAGGNMGIGITAPATVTDARLHIYNPTYLSGGPANDNVPGFKINRTYLTTGAHGAALNINPNIFEVWYQKLPSLSLNGGGATLTEVIDPTGNFGINTPTPGAPLDVNGSAIIRQNLAVTNNAMVGDSLTVTNMGTMGALSVANNATVGGNLTVTNVGTMGSLNTGNALVNNSLTVGNKLTVVDTATVGTLVTNNATINNATIGNTLTAYNLTATNIGYMYYLSANSGTINNTLTVNNYAVIGSPAGGSITLPTSGGMPGTEYSLYVANGILTEKLKVANHNDGTNWSDFVFNKDYNLMPLHTVESYVKANRHLPEIPSASEVAKDGIDVASMDAKLLQKIEELTLYVIQQQKEIDDLKKQIKH